MIVYSDTTADLKVTYLVHENTDVFYVTLNTTTTETLEALIVFEGTLDECVDYINKKIKE
jgi:hypothetical protein